MKRQIRIGIADDHSFVREGLIELLKHRKSDIKVLFDVGNGQQLLEQLDIVQPDIILLDIEMPVMGGLTAIGKIKELYPEIKIIVVSAYFDEVTILDCVKKGVNSFLPKGINIQKIIEAIEFVFEKGRFFNEDVSSILAKQIYKAANPDENGLTDQEIKIIRLICNHKQSKEIATELKLTKKTVDWYRDSIFKKTGVKSVTELVVYAIKNNLIKI
jgi:DNA-binding NarL/FixJ family response regulator